MAVNERVPQGQPSSTPKDKEAKRLNFFGRKIYSTAGLQFRISKQQALLARYDYYLCDNVLKLIDQLTEDAK